MTEWATETDMLELETSSGGHSDEYAPLFGREDWLTMHEDQRWLAYVARLAPDDRHAAFLLPDELPDAQSRPQQIRSAIEVAMRRAFAGPQFRIEGYELGRIQGEMRVLLPQGREIHFHFHNELGWKATVVIVSGSEERSFPAYYRSACMNPIRCAAIEGEFDTSEVRFTPLDGQEIEKIAADPEIDQMTARALKKLSGQYKMLST